MQSTLIKFPVTSFRKIGSPYDENGKTTYVAVVNVKDIPDAFKDWRELNPRDPKLSSGVAKAIADTLKDDPESFFFRNRGITIIVDHAEFDNQKNIASLEMVDKQKNGLLDGGHTFYVIRHFVENLSTEALSEFNAFVKIEILEGIKDVDAVINIVESRNTSTQVKQQGLEELRKRFNTIQEVLRDKSYASRIAYKEFELLEDGSPKDIDIKEILSYLICFDKEEYDGKKHPLKAYSSKAAVLNHFCDNQDRITKYIPLLPVILELRDTIYLELPEAYNHQHGKFGKLTDVTKGKTLLPFIGQESDYRIPSGFIYPILAAFRNLVSIKGDHAEWKTDPIKLFEQELKSDLAERIGEQALEFRNPNKLGKDMATWRSCYDLIELETLKRNLQ